MSADLEQQIRRAYWAIARRPQDWIRLTDLRNMIDVEDAVMDAELTRLYFKFGDIHLVPEADQKQLTEEDRARALRIRGQANHLIAIEGR